MKFILLLCTYFAFITFAQTTIDVSNLEKDTLVFAPNTELLVDSHQTCSPATVLRQEHLFKPFTPDTCSSPTLKNYWLRTKIKTDKDGKWLIEFLDPHIYKISMYTYVSCGERFWFSICLGRLPWFEQFYRKQENQHLADILYIIFDLFHKALQLLTIVDNDLYGAEFWISDSQPDQLSLLFGHAQFALAFFVSAPHCVSAGFCTAQAWRYLCEVLPDRLYFFTVERDDQYPQDLWHTFVSLGDTIFHAVKMPLPEAFYIVYAVSTHPKVTAEELSRETKISDKSCASFKKKIIDAEAKLKPKQRKKGWISLLEVIDY